MRNPFKLEIDDEIKENVQQFRKRLDSQMNFTSNVENDVMKYEWLDQVELICPYLDNLVRNPKVVLINESDIINIDKVKKVSVESVKHLSKNTQFIDEIDKETNDIKPSRVLVLRREETFNTYENRFLYTLITHLNRFIYKKEQELDTLEVNYEKVLEYTGATTTEGEKVNIKLKLTNDELPKNKKDKNFKKEIAKIKERIKRINDYLKSWKRSEFITSLDKAKITLVVPPILKTNLILKNPNFQMATKLWEFLQFFDDADKDNAKVYLDTNGDNILKGILDDTFMTQYFITNSISKSNREQKEFLAKYAVIMINQQIKRSVALLLNMGIKLTNKEIIDMILKEIKAEKTKQNAGGQEVKKKFKDTIEEYLERTQNYL